MLICFPLSLINKKVSINVLQHQVFTWTITHRDPSNHEATTDINELTALQRNHLLLSSVIEVLIEIILLYLKLYDITEIRT